MRVKICGITDSADALAASEAGADAIGLNFVGGPRRLQPAAARRILAVLPPMVTPVALVRVEQGQLPRDLSGLLTECRISHLQLYGDTSPALLAGLSAEGYRPMPVLAVKDPSFAQKLDEWGQAGTSRPTAVVLDAFDPDREGGTGRRFDWTWVAQARRADAADWMPIILAGGLTPENVAQAVQVARPYGVDVSSGVEIEGSPGRKDRERLFAFVRNARQAAGSHLA